MEGKLMAHRVRFDDAFRTVAVDGRVYFGSTVDPKIAAVFNKPAKIEDEKIDDSDLYKDDDDNDKDLEKDAIDKEGWFDKVKDPTLDTDDTPEDEGEGGN